ncbi:helix-turn-helix domain-containing protein [Lentibacillus salicampi]|uniref:Transposase IS30-like HTH domain-containing protein n=1 Tax=Lentibacillus salicampi TaxID=175306 RepID=A0A4Y9A703_9BACI|nr:hypothetical protein E4U82_17315 [Lentibacillus salicampi]
MTQSHSNTEERTFTHLTEIERGQLAAYLDEGVSLREIARRMGRDASTISRKKNRGTVQQIDTRRKNLYHLLRRRWRPCLRGKP